jgi:hypothetical protein
MPMMNEVVRLFAPEPGKPQEPRALDKVFPAEYHMRAKRRRASHRVNHKEFTR